MRALNSVSFDFSEAQDYWTKVGYETIVNESYSGDPASMYYTPLTPSYHISSERCDIDTVKDTVTPPYHISSKRCYTGAIKDTDSPDNFILLEKKKVTNNSIAKEDKEQPTKVKSTSVNSGIIVKDSTLENTVEVGYINNFFTKLLFRISSNWSKATTKDRGSILENIVKVKVEFTSFDTYINKFLTKLSFRISSNWPKATTKDKGSILENIGKVEFPNIGKVEFPNIGKVEFPNIGKVELPSSDTYISKLLTRLFFRISSNLSKTISSQHNNVESVDLDVVLEDKDNKVAVTTEKYKGYLNNFILPKKKTMGKDFFIIKEDTEQLTRAISNQHNRIKLVNADDIFKNSILKNTREFARSNLYKDLPAE